jgi:hypothetical protein
MFDKSLVEIAGARLSQRDLHAPHYLTLKMRRILTPADNANPETLEAEGLQF